MVKKLMKLIQVYHLYLMCFGAKTPVPKMVLIAAYLFALIFLGESYIEMPKWFEKHFYSLIWLMYVSFLIVLTQLSC